MNVHEQGQIGSVEEPMKEVGARETYENQGCGKASEPSEVSSLAMANGGSNERRGRQLFWHHAPVRSVTINCPFRVWQEPTPPLLGS